MITAVAFGAIGPRYSAPRNHAAGEPFVYTPPEGFTSPKDVKEAAKDLLAAKDDEREWVHEGRPGQIIVPRLHLRQSNARGTVEAEDLATIAKGMPGVLEESGVTWKDVRQETRTRADGARVGLIEGECTKTVTSQDMTLKTSSVQVRYRRLLFVFPTDEGSAFTTAVYGVDEIPTWQPALEASIGTARGVALRVPSPPAWMYFAWGGAGLVIGWLVSSLLSRRGTTPEPAKPAAAPKSEKDDA